MHAPTSIRLLALPLVIAAALVMPAAPASATENADASWNKDIGQMAPELVAAGWVGTPVSLSAVRGNVVVLGFWNADIPC